MKLQLPCLKLSATETDHSVVYYLVLPLSHLIFEHEGTGTLSAGLGTFVKVISDSCLASVEMVPPSPRPTPWVACVAA